MVSFLPNIKLSKHKVGVFLWMFNIGASINLPRSLLSMTLGTIFYPLCFRKLIEFFKALPRRHLYNNCKTKIYKMLRKIQGVTFWNKSLRVTGSFNEIFRKFNGWNQKKISPTRTCRGTGTIFYVMKDIFDGYKCTWLF